MALTRLPSFTLLSTDSYTFGNANVTGNVSAGNLKTDNLQYANGDPYVFTTDASGTNTQIQFNDSNSFAGSANLTFNKTTNTLSVDNIVITGNITPTANITFDLGNNTNRFRDLYLSGNTLQIGSGAITIDGNSMVLTNPAGGSFVVDGSNAAYASLASYVTEGNQSNITQVGTLVSLDVLTTISTGNLKTDNLQYANGVAYSLATSAQGSLADSAVQPGDNVSVLTNDAGYLVAGNLTGYATETFVGTEIANLVASAPSALNTLNELANALGNDASFSTSITNSLANKLSTSDFTSSANTAIDNRVTKSFVDNLAVVANVANVAYSVSASNISGTINLANYATTANSVAVANVSGIGNIATINQDGNASNILYGNGAFASAPVTYSNSNVATFLASFGSNTITTTGNISGGYILGNGSQLTGLPAGYTNTDANSAIDARVTKSFVDNLAVVANISNIAHSVAVANVTGIGNIATVNTDGNASNILYGNGSFAAAPTAGSGSLSALSDVALANLTNGDVLSYDSANSVWINTVSTGGTGSASSQYVTRTYTGDGANTAFTVSSGATTNSVIVTLSGIVQTPTTDYSVSSTTLTFTTAPPDGIAIQIREIGIPMSSGSNTQLLFNDAGSIGGTANLTFNKTTGMLTAAKLTTTSANLGSAANLKITGGNVGDLLATVGNGVLAWANVAANGNVIINGSVGGGGASVTVDTTPPESPSEGDLWLDSETGDLNVYFSDAWVSVTASAGQLDIQVNNFTGDGIQSEFTLTVTPAGSNYTLVTVGGVVQPRNYYSISGSTLEFGTAPPANTPVEISIFGGSASPIGLASSVTTAAQPNITSVGTLISLTSSGNITAPYFIGNGSSLTGITAATVTTAAQPNITSIGTLTSLSVTGNITGANLTGNLYGNGSAISAITAGNITGQVSNSLVSSTVYSNAQANITSLGTLTSLTVSGLSTFGTSAENFTTLSGATGVVAHNTATAGTFYHTTPAANFTANFTNVSTTSSKIIVLVLVIAQGASVYLPTVMQIDGTTQTVVWSGGSAPTGNANKYDVISYSLFRIGSSWTVFGSASSFG